MRSDATGRKFVQALTVMVGTVMVGIALGSLPARAVRADNLTEAFIGAYNTSGLLEQNRALLRVEDENLATAMAALRPIINWTIEVSRDYSRERTGTTLKTNKPARFQTGITLSHLIYNGGFSAPGRQAAQEIVLSTRQNLRNVEQQILFRAADAYLGVLLQEETVQIRMNNVDVSAEALRAYRSRFEVGEIGRTDIALAEAQFASAQADLAVARGDLSSAQAEYVTAAGKQPGRTEGSPKLPDLPWSEAEAVNLAQRTHPSILSAQHQVRALDLQVQQQHANLGPKVSLNVNADIREQSGNDDNREHATLALRLEQPIYTGGRLAATLRQAMANRDAARANLVNVQKDIIQGVANAYAAFQATTARLGASAERVRAAQVAFDGIREEATLGARSLLDLVIAQQDLLDARLQEVTARVDRSRTAYQLLQALGLLTVEHLGLAVQIYDPTHYHDLVKKAPARISTQGRELDRVLKALRLE